MPVNIKPTSVIKARLGIEPNGRVQKFFTNTCAIHMDKYVPFDSGTLAETVVIGGKPTRNVTANTITYDTLYARYQYYGVREDGSHRIDPEKRDKSKHPQATSFWDKKMVSIEMQQVVKEVQDYVNRGGK